MEENLGKKVILIKTVTSSDNIFLGHNKLKHLIQDKTKWRE
jgi:hypothetical protein